jgi:hypothetical protein
MDNLCFNQKTSFKVITEISFILKDYPCNVPVPLKKIEQDTEYNYFIILNY